MGQREGGKRLVGEMVLVVLRTKDRLLGRGGVVNKPGLLADLPELLHTSV